MGDARRSRDHPHPRGPAPGRVTVPAPPAGRPRRERSTRPASRAGIHYWHSRRVRGRRDRADSSRRRHGAPTAGHVPRARPYAPASPGRTAWTGSRGLQASPNPRRCAMTPEQRGVLGDAARQPAGGSPPALGRPAEGVRSRARRCASTRSARSTPALPQATSLIPRSARSPPATAMTAEVGGTAAHGHDFLVSQGEPRPVRGRPDRSSPARDPVPAVRLDRHPAQGRADDPALDHRELRRARLDLPGGPPGERAPLRRRSGTPSPATRSSCSACSSACRWTTRSCSSRGSRRRTGGPATTPRRSPRAWRRRPA